MLPIMDVSRWQGSINWDKVKASGLVSGVMLKTVSTNRKLSKRKDGLYIQKMLGHANIATTMIYADVQSDDVRNQHKKYVV